MAVDDELRLPPRTLPLSLPAMSTEQAAQMIDLVDALQKLLWDAYADAMLDLAQPDDAPPDPDDPALPF